MMWPFKKKTTQVSSISPASTIDIVPTLEYVEISVGDESARRLSKILGRVVKAGEVFKFDPSKPHVFSDPRMNADLHPEF